MSADNWTVCPRCKAAAESKVKQLEVEAEDGYGKLPKSEYFAKLGELEQARQCIAEFPTDLREDYELGVLNGEFYVAYTGQCNECTWRHSFKHREAVTP